jgi:A/G-specific adenine glycosylase
MGKKESSEFKLLNQRFFKSNILDYYDVYGRNFPWRISRTPYRILVSEILLQQTKL